MQPYTSLIMCFMDSRPWYAPLPVFGWLVDASKIKLIIFFYRLKSTNRDSPNNLCCCVCVCAEMKVMKVYIEFSLDQPKGGLHFVVPDVEGSMAERAAHVFSFGNQNSTR